MINIKNKIKLMKSQRYALAIALLLLISGSSAMAEYMNQRNPQRVNDNLKVFVARTTQDSRSRAPSREIAAQMIRIVSPVIDNGVTKNNSSEAFMQLDNRGHTAHEVIAAFTPIANQIQLHRSVRRGNKTFMYQVKDILVPPNNHTNLKLGGLHLMLIDLRAPLREHQLVPITILFQDGSWVIVNARVVSKV